MRWMRMPEGRLNNMPETMMLQKQNTPELPLSRKDYTLHLLQYAAANDLLPAERLGTIRDELHKAAAERAAQYTAGKSTTVTRKQAEAFYDSVFTQLDAVLLTAPSDADALEELRTAPLSELLEQGAMLTIHAYEFAKEHFRKAYRETKPVQTSFFRALLKDFEQFCTKYDARFRAKDTKITYSYPLLCGRQIPENGAVGVCRYYAALSTEADFLCCFDPEDIRAMMTRYAQRYLTSPDMIAENIAELVLRHWVIRLLCGAEGFSAAVSSDMIEAVQAEYGSLPAEQLCDLIRGKLEAQLLPVHQPILDYLAEMIPAFAEAMHGRMTQNRLEGWLAPDKKES